MAFEIHFNLTHDMYNSLTGMGSWKKRSGEREKRESPLNSVSICTPCCNPNFVIIKVKSEDKVVTPE